MNKNVKKIASQKNWNKFQLQSELGANNLLEAVDTYVITVE